MKHLLQGLLLASMIIPQFSFACSPDGKEGFLPQNNFKIPVNAKRTGGISLEQFNSVIDNVESMYAPLVSQEGGNLKVVRNWDDATVNAYAQQAGKEWKVSMFGGLARHDTITADGFALVVCHEIGHHIGGAPRKSSMGTSVWASNEGQADYWATLKCLRRVWNSENNEEIIKQMEIPQHLATTCGRQRVWNVDVALCIRGGMAGMSVAKLFQSLSRETNEPKFETPHSSVVVATNDRHPQTQCRLDTYFQGGLCESSFNENVNSKNEVDGTCHGSLGHKKGLRPACWFKPSVK